MSHGVKVIVPQTPVFPGIPVVGFTPASGVSAAGTFTDGQTVFLQFNSTAFTSKADARPLYMLPFQTNLTTDPTFSRTAQTMVDPGNGNTQIQSAITPTNAAGACQFIPTTTSGGTSTAFLNSPHFAVTGGAGYRIYANIEYYNGMSAMPQNDKMWRLWPASGVGGTNTPDVYHAFSGGNNEYITDNENVINATGLNANGHFMPLPKNVGVWEIREHFWKENTYGLIDGVNNMAINSQLGIPPGALWGPCNINNAGALNPAGAGPMNKLYLDQFSVANPPNFTTDKGIYGCIWIDDDDCQLLATDEGSTLQLALANFGATNFKRVPQVQLVRTVNGSTVNLQVVVRRGSHAALGGKNLLLKSSHFAAINLGVFTTPVVVTTSSLPSATQGVAYSQSLAASGGTAPYTYTLVTATPNSGGWINVSSAGVVTGTSGTAETETITVFATDSLGATSVNQPVSLTVAAVGAAFDFYISPTGSDTNPGTLASPWAITSLKTVSPNFSKFNGKGKKIGFMPGFYDVSTLMVQDPVVGALQWPGGTASQNNVFSSCDASGNYSPRTATINAKTPGGVYGGGSGSLSWNGCIVSHSGLYPTPYTTGYITIDGIIFTGWSYKGIRIGGASGGYGPGSLPGIIIQNNRFTDGGPNATDPTDNSCAFWGDGTLAMIVQNNKSDTLHGFGGSTTSADHLNGFIFWRCVGTIISNNSCVSLGGNIYGKEILNQGSTIHHNYVDLTGYTSGTAYGIQDFTGANSTGLTQTTKIYANVIITTGRGLGGSTLSNAQGFTTPVEIYNNTVIGSNATYAAYWFQSQNTFNNVKFYNNIVAASLTGGAGANGGSDGTIHVNPGSPVVLDYNMYCTSAGFQLVTNASGAVVIGSYSTKAAFSATISANSGISNAEANTVITSTPGFVNTGSGAAMAVLLPSSPGHLTGRVGGTSAGAATDMGAYGVDNLPVGCNF